MTMTTAADFAQQLKEQFGELISEPTEFRGEISLNVAEADRIAEVCTFAKHELGFDYLIDISTLDHYGEDPRFSVVYELSGIEHRQHLRLKTTVTEEKSELPSVTSVWRPAAWPPASPHVRLRKTSASMRARSARCTPTSLNCWRWRPGCSN